TSGSAECAGSERATQSAEGASQRGHLVARRPSARVGQHPDSRAGDRLVLRARARPRTAEGDPIRAYTDERDHPRAVATDLSLDPAPPPAQVVRCELVRARGRAVDEVRDAQPSPKERRSFPRLEQPIGEAGGVERAPEAVSRPREVKAHRAGPKTRVDADEEDVERRGDEVRDALATRRVEVGAGRTPRRYRICPFGGGWQRGQRYMSSRPWRVLMMSVPQRGQGLPFRNRTCMCPRIFVPNSGGRPSSTSRAPRPMTSFSDR